MKKPKFTIAQQKERYKQCVLIELSNYLYNIVIERKEDYNESKLRDIRTFIDNHYKEHRKEMLALKKDSKAAAGLEYSKASLHRLIQILTYLKLPNETVLKKFKEAYNKDEKAVYQYLVQYEEKDLHIEELTICKYSEDYHDECYISLINTLECMGYSDARSKDMSFIKNNEFYDLCNYCGLIEAYKARPQLTIRKVNEILRTYDTKHIFRK